MDDIEKIHEDHYDFDKGDEFTADYTPAGSEDLPPIARVRVRVLDFSDDEGGYGWEIIGPPGFVEDQTNEQLIRGFGFDEFDNIDDFDQATMRGL